MDKWSPKIWSPWTNGPQPIWSPWTNGPQKYKNILFVQEDRLWGSRNTGTKLVVDHLSRETKLIGDHLSRGTEFLGTICPWGQNWLGTVCPEGPINWGPIVGDQMSGDHMCLGPNVSQPYIMEFLTGHLLSSGDFLFTFCFCMRKIWEATFEWL